MSFLKNTVSLLALLCVMPAATAATARPSVLNATNVRRMPTFATYTGATTGTAGTVKSGTTTAATLLANAECIDAYTECMKGEDACGSDFEECTTKELFHGQMPKCLNVLAQCESGGVEALFGTKDISALGATTGSDDTPTYTYPTDGSVMGQWISAAAINNQYDTATCVKRYTSCLQRDSVCGADFELCTGDRDFKKQALLCDSTLARCQKAGVTEMLGTYPWSANAAGSKIGGRVAAMIEDGAQLAAMNAVSTCYKVVDQCFLGACTANPFRCTEGSSFELIKAADLAGEEIDFTSYDQNEDGENNKTKINRYLHTSCVDKIGSNKYCHITFREKTPKDKDLSDPDLQEDVFAMAVDQRKPYIDSKIKDLMTTFDKNAKEKCVETITNCAMRTCGGGSGAACYSSAFGTDGKNTINGPKTYADIERGCAAIVNTDSKCIYAAASLKETNEYSYSYIDENVFGTLFPEYDDAKKSDPIGVVASLNAKLSTSYNDAAIAQMKKRCQSVATSCVKSMCGADYVNCYRNRTDIYSSVTNTGNDAFDKSMNTVGGVLDYTIVLGLCVDTVKNADVCAEHLAIEQAKIKKGDDYNPVWGGASSAHDSWLDAGATKSIVGEDEIYATDENGNKLCENASGNQGVCDTTDASGAVYDKPVVIGYDTYVRTQAANTLFEDLIYDLEIEAQAKYNAKLTKQMNMCREANNGGIMGNKELGSTFMWVKLKSNKVPTNYATAGLKTNDYVATHDLYGSFCRVRVTLQSDDKRIQDAINNGADWSTAYFAAGDTFTCGSWIPNDKLEELAKAAGADARTEKENSQYDGLKWWSTAIGALGGGVGGAYLGRAIYDGDVFGGLSEGGKPRKQSFQKNQDDCIKNVERAVNALNNRSVENAYNYALKAEDAARKIDVSASAWPEDVATSKYKAKQDNEDKQYYCGTNSSPVQVNCVGDMFESDAINEIRETLYELRTECRDQTKKGEDPDESNFGPRGAAGIGAGVTAIAGGALGYLVVDQIQKQELSAAEQAAIKEFMDNVGSKIRCFVGPDEVGMYGDMISTSME